MTTNLSRGISRSIFLRLWVRAPRTSMVSMVLTCHLCANRTVYEDQTPADAHRPLFARVLHWIPAQATDPC